MARAEAALRPGRAAPGPALAIGVIGPGRVGSVLLQRLAQEAPHWCLGGVANSSHMILGSDVESAHWQRNLTESGRSVDLDGLAAWLGHLPARRRVMVDITASPEVARRHADWLEAGYDVVTANKWALAAPRRQYERLSDVRRGAGVSYLRSATVGAGLPVLAALDNLRRAGESVLSFGGVLSGTMSFLTHRVSTGQRPSGALREALAEGLTEPDPRADLDGLDVARKLVILGREAGLDLDLEDVAIESLVPPDLREVSVDAFLTASNSLDEFWQQQAGQAPGQGSGLCHVGRVDEQGRARVGLERCDRQSALASLGSGENLIEIRTPAYCRSPLVIRGPGAGLEVTALALWGGLRELEAAGLGAAGASEYAKSAH